MLVLKRNDKDLYPNCWDLPGGHKKNNETFDECVIREFKEETGLNVKINKLEFIKSQIYNGKIITVLIYSVLCNEKINIQLDCDHVLFDFINAIEDKSVIWYLKDYNENKL